jgi:hypothetical protein
MQLSDEMFVEEMDKNGEGYGEGEEAQQCPNEVEEDALEGILDSPETANRRARLKAQMHTLSSQSACGTCAYEHTHTHQLNASLCCEANVRRLSTELFFGTCEDILEKVDDHAFEKRAKLIKKRFKLMPWMVRERNMLWFAPPIEELQGRSLGFFGEWDPIRIICVDLLRNPAIQTVFFLINIIAITVLAVRPARETVNWQYDVYGEPAPAPYYSITNIYFIAEVIAFLTLAAELMLTVVARGLIQGHYAFVKDPFNVLDAVILVISFAEHILWSMGWTVILRGFRVLRVLKLMMLINVAEGCRAVVTGVRNSVEFVSVVFLIVIVLLLAFAAGLPQLFGKQMNRRCVVERTDTQYVINRFNNTDRLRVAYGNGFGFCQIYNTSTSLQGWLTSEDSCPKQANALIAESTAGAGVNQVCDPLIVSPFGGLLEVDTIWSSFIAMLQSSAGDAFHINPWMFSEAEPKWANFSWIILGMPSICCSLFLFQAMVALGACKYYETRLEQKTGQERFLNVLGSAQTHEHHHQHHTHILEPHLQSTTSDTIGSHQGESVEEPEDGADGAEELPNSSTSNSLGSNSPKSLFGQLAEAPMQSGLRKSQMTSYKAPNSPTRRAVTNAEISTMKTGNLESPLSRRSVASGRSRNSHLSGKSSADRVGILGKGLLDVSCILSIMVNNVMLILELQERSAGYGNDASSTFSIARLFFSLLFMVEVILRLIQSGSIYKHFRKVTSAVDFSIVFVDAAGLFAVAMGSARWHVLRGVAAVRLYRIALLLPGSGQLMQATGRSFVFLMSALAVPVVFIVGCSIMTHHYFGEGLKFGHGQRFSYFTFMDSFRMMMHVAWGDKWHEIIYGSMHSAANVSLASRIKPHPQAMAYVGVVLLVVIFYTMRFWLKGLFIGVIGECFSLGDIEHDALTQAQQLVGPMLQWAAFKQAQISNLIAAGDKAGVQLIVWSAKACYRFTKKWYSKLLRRLFPYWDLSKPIEIGSGVAPGEGPSTSVANKPQVKEDQGESPDYEVFGDVIDTVLGAPRRPPVLGHPDHTSLWVPIFGGLRYKNPIRILCRVILGSKPWKVVINLTVLLSSIFIFIGETNRAALPNQRVAEPTVRTTYTVTTYIYIAEFIMHVFAQGLVFPSRAYLREAENIFDFTLLVINLVDFRLENPSPFLRAILILRLLRLFRPSRPFRNGEGMIYHTVMGALIWITLMAVFIGFIYLVFAVIGMEIFSGQLHSCSCTHIKFPAGQFECQGGGISGPTKDGFYGDLLKPAPFSGEGFWAPCAWNAEDVGNFDTLPDALLALARISGRKWSDLMEACMSIAGRGRQPVPSSRADTGLYFAVFFAVSALLIENLAAAFMIQGFGRGLHFAKVSKEQMQIETIEKVIVQVQPSFPREWPTNFVAIRCRKLIKYIWFRRFTWVAIFVHAVLLLLPYGGMEKNFRDFIMIQNYVLWGLLCAETLIVFAAFGPKNFASVPFHWFDVALITLGAYSIGAGLVNECAFPRILRVLRLFTVIAPKNPSLGFVNEMFHYSMGMVLQSLALFVIALVIFSLVGFSMFAYVRPGVRLGRTANFDTFGMSVVTLVQVVLGDEWQQLMIDCSVQPPFCNDILQGLDSGDCGTPFAPSFFLSYQVVVNALCLNIVVASFIHGLQYSRMKRSTLGPYPNIRIEGELIKFAQHWKKFDPGSTRKMKVSIVASFLLQLPKPLGFGKVSKLQKLSDFQRSKSQAITTELAIIAGLSDGIEAGTPVIQRFKQALRFLLKVLVTVACFCFMRRKKKKKKKDPEPDEDEDVDYEGNIFMLGSQSSACW